MCVSCLWGNSFILELTFEYDGTQTENLKPDASAACSIDLGLNNFATMISTKAEVPFLLVKGGKVKSINPWRNKQVAELKSLGKPGHIAAKSRRRYSRMEDYLHKASCLVIEYCLTYDLGTIIIGYNPQWKTEYLNGALNIARKELGDEWLKKQLKANGGRMNRPVSVRNIGQTLKEGLRSLETASVRAL